MQSLYAIRRLIVRCFNFLILILKTKRCEFILHVVLNDSNYINFFCMLYTCASLIDSFFASKFTTKRSN